ncbi:MAG TPA: family 43 glycosylhydrolase [Bryobacteraceae bacterium]|nr:family 43 glycosylhydrolase [Bryobacteraceae bacterium]
MRISALFLLCTLAASGQPARHASQAWVADQGDGTYNNPILYADYSDPDPVRVGDDYYLTASSFDAVPGLPILHSKDLVNWELIGHVYAEQPPADVFAKPQHGGGAWAPALRHHAGEFYIFWPDPDLGIYMSHAKNAAGPWSAPLLIKQAKGWIDPCPLWDDDGRAYLVNAFAASRSGLKSQLIVSRMAPDGTRLLDSGTLVFDGHPQDPTLEGPKLYKRNGYYYIFAPAGGVPTGWQLALRSKSIYGPYERKVVLAQGKTATNGPHQGGWVDTPLGEYWFVHFQDNSAYGRIVHLEPMKWVDDWPVIGDDGAPTATHRKPKTAHPVAVATPADSDEFDAPTLGLQWQWQANPRPGWAFPSAALGALRIFCIPAPEGARNLWDVPNLLLQKFMAPAFTATAKVTFSAHTEGEKTGLLIMGTDYAYIAVTRRANGLAVSQVICQRADRGSAEKESAPASVPDGPVYLRVRVADGAHCRFSYSTDNLTFHDLGEPFMAQPGRWIGAKVGLFATRSGPAPEFGYADYDWFRVTGGKKEPAYRFWHDFTTEARPVWSDARGYGFEPTAAPDKPPYYFSVRVPAEGNYKVTVTLGDPRAATVTTVKAELRRLMLARARTAPGEIVTRTFLVNTRRPELPSGGQVRLKPRETTAEAWAWDDRLTLEFTDDHPAVRTLEITPARVPTIYIAGDSTSTDQPLEPYNSWGQMLTRFFNSEIAVANHGESGESLRGFIGEHRLEKVMSVIQPGDFLLIQMGHNDQKERGEGVGAFTTYKADLKRFMAEARAHGATPILITSMHRLNFDDTGHIVNTLGDYPEAVRQTAREENVALIDLNAVSKPFYEALGPQEAHIAFAGNDTTHHSDYGSYELARAIVQSIKDQKLPLARYLLDVPPFDPAHPDPSATFDIPAEPLGPLVKPYGN